MSNTGSRLLNWITHRAIPWYTSLGLTKGTLTLEVRGRKTGKPIHVSLTAVRHEGSRYLVSLAGESQWARNIRAAEGRAVIISGSRTSVRLVEIPDAEKPPVLLGYVQQRAFTHSGEESARLFFGLGPKPSLADMQAIAGRYIVFCIENVPHPPGGV
jgi:deazaflavin-dependent oxidoreductase (nitroreductase family)